jgi:putative peptidoglycan lipid II flippase
MNPFITLRENLIWKHLVQYVDRIALAAPSPISPFISPLDFVNRIRHSRTARKSINLILLCVLSPATGLLVEMSLAQRFGASGAMDAYRVCSLLVVFTQQTLMVQLLPTVLVPLFADAQARGMVRQAWSVAVLMMFAAALATTLLISAIRTRPSLVTTLLAPRAASALKADIEMMATYAAVAVGFIAMSAVITGVLMAYQVYHVAWTSQIASNSFFAVFLLSRAKTASVQELAFGTSISAAIVLLVHTLCALRLWRAQTPTALPSAGRLSLLALLREVFQLSAPALLILGVQQLTTVFINRSLVSGAVGDAASFGYAWKLLVIVSVVPFSITTVYFPILASCRARGDMPGVIAITKRLTILTTIIAALIVPSLLAFHRPLTALLFGHGRMSPKAVTQIATLYALLLLGAIPNLLQAVCTRICLALRLPSPLLKIAGLSIVVTLAFLPAAHSSWGAAGVASLVSASSWLTGIGITVLMLRAIRRDTLCRAEGLIAPIELRTRKAEDWLSK